MPARWSPRSLEPPAKPCFAGGSNNLSDHLPGTEIARQPHQTRGAKRTTDGTSDLTRDADGSASGIEHEDGFQNLTVACPVERLDRLAITSSDAAHRFQK